MKICPYYRKANRLLELGNFDYDKAEGKILSEQLEPSAEGPLAPTSGGFVRLVLCILARV